MSFGLLLLRSSVALPDIELADNTWTGLSEVATARVAMPLALMRTAFLKLGTADLDCEPEWQHFPLLVPARDCIVTI